MNQSLNEDLHREINLVGIVEFEGISNDLIVDCCEGVAARRLGFASEVLDVLEKETKLKEMMFESSTLPHTSFHTSALTSSMPCRCVYTSMALYIQAKLPEKSAGGSYFLGNVGDIGQVESIAHDTFDVRAARDG